MNLIFDVSGHGYGHAAMSLPVIRAICDACPAVRLTIRSTLPEAWLRARVTAPFTYSRDRDFGMLMVDSLHVHRAETLARYQARHAIWPEVVAREVEELAIHAPDLVVSNISYLSFAAASTLNVPSIAFSSLNWADVFYAYCGELKGAADVRAHMTKCYSFAEVFLQPRPSMPMPSISNGRETAPVAQLGRDRRDEIARILHLKPGERLLVVSLGGIATPLSFAQWPPTPGWRVISGAESPPDGEATVPWTALGMPFIDVLASADALIIKPGYGLVTEAACNGRPTLCIPRPGWPESDAQIAWLAKHGRLRMIEEADLRAGCFSDAADEVIARAAPRRPAPDGVAEVRDILLTRLEATQT